MEKVKEKKTAKRSAKKTKTSKAASIDASLESAEETKSAGPGKNLVIVESPAKAKTLKKYLGRSFDVKASVGHVKDLPKSKLGVDIEKDFEPTYQVIEGKKKVISELTKAAQNAPKVYLASDPDREGEAIAWHVAQEIGVPDERIHRVLFHEITKPAVLKAIEEPIALNKDRYESQQARRVLDRLVGYKISPILWTKVRRGLSAGRVQSVALKILVDREKEVLAFVPQPYWTVSAMVAHGAKEFMTRLVRAHEKKIDRTTIDNIEWADQIVAESQQGAWVVTSVEKKTRRRNPYPPFITSTLQQEASKRCYFSAKKTMTLAQQLYEGIDLGDAGSQGLITYMRTDSTRLSNEALTQAREWISNSFGKQYLPDAPIEYKNKKNAQDAHEAIRPTSVEFPPDRVKHFLDEDQFKLYDLIWKRFMACQMVPAVFDQTSADIEIKGSKGIVFRATGSVLKFDGFLRLWKVEEDNSDDYGNDLPELHEGETLELKKVAHEKHMTQPPPRFSESSLIKELEEKGIGRPSTYASILSTIQDRKYAEKKENRFVPSELGTLVTELLSESFGNIMDVGFTAKMEDQLDQIEEGQVNWVNALKTFYGPFEETVKIAQEKMRDIKRQETPTSLTCPKCSKPVILKWGKNGKFAACQGYPECRFTSEFEMQPGGEVKLVSQPTTDEKCPNCTEPMIVKTGRFGKFLACSGYPKCKTTKPLTTGIACPDCKEGQLTEKRTRFGKVFYSCTRYPNCKHALWDKPLKNTSCPQCQHPFLVERYTKKEGASTRCPNKECGYVQPQSSASSALG